MKLKYLMLGAMLSTTAYAQYPDANVNCVHKSKRIQQASAHGAVKLYFNETCDIAYVAPPGDALKRISDVPALHERVSSCPLVRNLTNYLGGLGERIETLQRIEKQKRQAAEEAMVRIETYKDQRIEKSASLSELTYLYSNLEQEYHALISKKVALQDKILECKRDCIVLEAELLELNKKIHNRKQALQVKQTNIRKLESDLSRLNSLIASETVEYNDNMSAVDAMAKQVTELLSKIDATRENLLAKYGGTFSVEMDLKWDELVNDLQNTNSELGVEFKKLKINASRIYLNPFDAERNLKIGHMLISRYVPDRVFQVVGSESAGEIAELPTGPNLLYLNSVSLDINLGGVCPLLDENNEIDPTKLQSLRSLFNTAVAYDFVIKQNASYKISYNLEQSLQAIVAEVKDKRVFRLSDTEADKYLKDFKVIALDVHGQGDRMRFLRGLKKRHLRNIVEQILEYDQDNPSTQSVFYRLQLTPSELDQKVRAVLQENPSILVEESNGALYTLERDQINFKEGD